MPLTIAAVDVPEIEYGDPIPISFNYIYNNELNVNWATQEGSAAMDAELELGYGNGARQNLGIWVQSKKLPERQHSPTQKSLNWVPCKKQVPLI